MLAGQGVEALYASLEHLDLFSIGLNCATGPEFMTDHLRSLAAIATCFVTVYPNAGLPDENGHYEETADSLALKMRRFVEEGWVNAVGGCCGTTPAHILALRRLVEGHAPRRPVAGRPAAVSGIEVLYPNEDTRPVLVGERTNVIGSRKFKDLIVQGLYEEAAEVGRAQVRGGGQVLDVCLANPDRDEAEDTGRFMDLLTRMVKVPLMIDSTDPAVIELALKQCQGKSIVNSINLEDGEERFERVVPLLRAYGAAVVVGCIDEDPQQGMAVSRARKLAIAERAHALLTGKLRPRRPATSSSTRSCSRSAPATGTMSAPRWRRSRACGPSRRASPTARPSSASRTCRSACPRPGARCSTRSSSITAPRPGSTTPSSTPSASSATPPSPTRTGASPRTSSTMRGADPVGAFAAHFRGRSGAPRAAAAALPLDERLARYIVEGSRDGLVDDLGLKLQEAAPLDIINGPLMKGMEEVGRLFNDNQLIVAEVLQSAEAMKAAVAYLEPLMERAESATRASIVLATVKGDVHDIGKNLVEIILKNNGYRVINLGIKVPPEVVDRGLSRAQARRLRPVRTAREVRPADGGHRPGPARGRHRDPALRGRGRADAQVHGDAHRARVRGPTLYARDAMDGLDLANRLFGATTREGLLEALRAEQEALRGGGAAAAPPPSGARRPGRPGPRCRGRCRCRCRPTSTSTCCGTSRSPTSTRT